MEAILEQLVHSPKLKLYAEEIENVLTNEQKRREEFYRTVSEDVKMEFINGEIFIHSPAKFRHTDILGNLYMLIKAYLKFHNVGWVGSEKVMISLTRNDYEPDICFFSKEKSEKFKSDQMQFPAPDFVVEILSPSTEEHDRVIKFEDYSAHGVKEYWIIDPDNQVVEQYILDNKEYKLKIKSDSGMIKSVAIQGFEIPITAIFNDDESLKVLQTIVYHK